MLRSIVNLNPWEDMQRFADLMDRTFGSAGESSVQSNQASFTLPIDVYERDNKLFVRAAVPGVKPEDLEVTVDKGVLTIRGETKLETESNETKVYRREYRYGAFTRSLRLPQELDTESIDAEFDNGFVIVSIPRLIQQKPEPKRVQVRSATPISARAESTVNPTSNSEHANSKK